MVVEIVGFGNDFRYSQPDRNTVKKNCHRNTKTRNDILRFGPGKEMDQERKM